MSSDGLWSVFDGSRLKRMAGWPKAQCLAAARIFALALPPRPLHDKNNNNRTPAESKSRSFRNPRPPSAVWWVTEPRVPHSYDSESRTIVIRSGTSDYEDDDDYDFDYNDERDEEVRVLLFFLTYLTYFHL